MSQIWASAIPAVIAAVVSLITFFSNKNSKILDKIEQLEARQTKFEDDYALELAKQARTRILRFNNELMCGNNFTKEYFEDVIENVTYRVETDEATRQSEYLISESKDRNKIPACHILDENGDILRT